MTKNVAPSVKETAFSCPHCGAYTTQFWYKLYAQLLPDKDPKPFIPSEAGKERLAQSSDIPQEHRKEMLDWIEKLLTGLVYLEYVTVHTLESNKGAGWWAR